MRIFLAWILVLVSIILFFEWYASDTIQQSYNEEHYKEMDGGR